MCSTTLPTADTTTSKEETLGLPPAEETEDFRKLDELEKRDNRMSLDPEAAILEESIRKRLALKSITEVCYTLLLVFLAL